VTISCTSELTMENTPIIAAPAKNKLAHVRGIQGESAKPETPIPSKMSMISASRPFRCTFPRAAMPSAPTTEPAPDMETNVAAIPGPR